MDWFLSLKIFEQIVFSVAVAASFVVLVQIFLVVINFYGTDKLNADPENLELYENIATNDSDMSKNKVRIFSVSNINIFLSICGWSYFAFRNILSSNVLLFVCCVLTGALASILYACAYFFIKRKLKKRVL